MAKGTNVGTVTDLNGSYSLNVPAGVLHSPVILVSGNCTRRNKRDMKVLLTETVNCSELSQNQSVNSEDLNSSASRSVLNALQRESSQVKIGQASGAVGASTRVVLRGKPP